MEIIMKKKLLALTITAATLFASTQAAAEVSLSFASDITVDLSAFVGDASNLHDGLFGSGDIDNKTGKFDDLGFTGMWATSIYDYNDTSVDGAFFDTNIGSELAAYGVPGTYSSAAGGGSTVALSLPIAPGQTNIDALNPISDTVLGSTADDEGYGTSWFFTTEFHIDGTLAGGLPDYTGGSFDIIFNSAVGGVGDGETVLSGNFNRDSVVVDGTATSAASAQLWFNITSAKADLFTVYSSPSDLVGTDLSTLAGVAGPEFRLAFVTDPAVPTPESLALVDTNFIGGANVGDVAIRQTTLDGSGQLPTSVPEPGSLALLGIGLMGLASRRFKL